MIISKKKIKNIYIGFDKETRIQRTPIRKRSQQHSKINFKCSSMVPHPRNYAQRFKARKHHDRNQFRQRRKLLNQSHRLGNRHTIQLTV